MPLMSPMDISAGIYVFWGQREVIDVIDVSMICFTCARLMYISSVAMYTICTWIPKVKIARKRANNLS